MISYIIAFILFNMRYTHIYISLNKYIYVHVFVGYVEHTFRILHVPLYKY